MRKTKSNPIAILIFILYFVTIFGYGLSLLIYRNNGPTRVQAAEKEIIKVINSTMKTIEPGTAEFTKILTESKELSKYTDSPSDLFAMTLSLNGKIIYAYPQDLQYEDFTITSPLIVPKHDTLYSQQGIPVKYNAAYYYLSPQKIYTNGRVVFFILLFLTFISALCLIMSYVKYPDNGTKENDDFEDDFNKKDIENTSIHEETVSYNQLDETIPENDYEAKNPVIMKYKDNRPSRTELFQDYPSSKDLRNILPEEKSKTTVVFQDETENDYNAIQENTETCTEELPIKEEINFSSALNSEPKEEEQDILFLTPQNVTFPDEEDEIYSKTTGFGKEKYMFTQLNSELVEVSAADEDLTVFVIRIPGVSRESEASQKICEFIRQMDGIQDFAFEYKNDGFILIMPTIDIDYGLQLSENLHTGIVSILESLGYEGLCYIGISSKSVRIITGERLIREAEQALFHAQEEENSPVIAFRVDPTKYREYLAKEAQKLNNPE